MAPRRKLSDVRRTQILEAAVEIIGERGLCDTRISDVASRAGSSSALVIYYFESKDRLLAEALAFSEERFYAQTATELAKLTTAKDRLTRLLELSCAMGGTEGQLLVAEWLLWLDLWARAPRDPDVAKDRATLDRRWRDTIAGIVREGQAGGEFTRSTDPAEFALRLGALIDGLSIQVVLNDPDVSARRMFDLCLGMAGHDLGFEVPVRRRTGRTRRTTVAATPS